ncbi:MAG: hypothetical protein IT438_02020 [Phycisphaerales bacterium]|nr:hypothetical protein [Phycisphaerales bacterium]
MSIIPKVKVEQVEFCESHAPLWAVAPATIGLSTAQCTLFTTLTTNARKAYDDAQDAKVAYRSAVTTQNEEIAKAISGPGGAADLIRFIKSFAENTANPNSIYAQAGLPTPTPPSPLPAPGRPEDIVVTLEPSGAVTITWSAVEAAASTGAYFNVTRKLPGMAVFQIVGGSPGATSESRRMSFTDFTIPTSAAGAGVQYIIQGRRAGRIGEASDAVTVQFGVDGAGVSVAGAELKMAA